MASYRITNFKNDCSFIVRENESNNCWKPNDKYVHTRCFRTFNSDTPYYFDCLSFRMEYLFKNDKSPNIKIKYDSNGEPYLELLPMIKNMSLEKINENKSECLIDENDITLFMLRITSANHWVRLDKYQAKLYILSTIALSFYVPVYIKYLKDELLSHGNIYMSIILPIIFLYSSIYLLNKIIDDDNYVYSWAEYFKSLKSKR